MSKPTTELAHLLRVLKAPGRRPRAAQARRSRPRRGVEHEQFAAALVKTETDSRDSRGGQARIKAAFDEQQ